MLGLLYFNFMFGSNGRCHISHAVMARLLTRVRPTGSTHGGTLNTSIPHAKHLLGTCVLC